MPGPQQDIQATLTAYSNQLAALQPLAARVYNRSHYTDDQEFQRSIERLSKELQGYMTPAETAQGNPSASIEEAKRLINTAHPRIVGNILAYKETFVAPLVTARRDLETIPVNNTNKDRLNGWKTSLDTWLDDITSLEEALPHHLTDPLPSVSEDEEREGGGTFQDYTRAIDILDFVQDPPPEWPKFRDSTLARIAQNASALYTIRDEIEAIRQSMPDPALVAFKEKSEELASLQKALPLLKIDNQALTATIDTALSTIIKQDAGLMANPDIQPVANAVTSVRAAIQKGFEEAMEKAQARLALIPNDQYRGGTPSEQLASWKGALEAQLETSNIMEKPAGSIVRNITAFGNIEEKIQKAYDRTTGSLGATLETYHAQAKALQETLGLLPQKGNTDLTIRLNRSIRDLQGFQDEIKGTPDRLKQHFQNFHSARDEQFPDSTHAGLIEASISDARNAVENQLWKNSRKIKNISEKDNSQIEDTVTSTIELLSTSNPTEWQTLVADAQQKIDRIAKGEGQKTTQPSEGKIDTAALAALRKPRNRLTDWASRRFGNFDQAQEQLLSAPFIDTPYPTKKDPSPVYSIPSLTAPNKPGPAEDKAVAKVIGTIASDLGPRVDIDKKVTEKHLNMLLKAFDTYPNNPIIHAALHETAHLRREMSDVTPRPINIQAIKENYEGRIKNLSESISLNQKLQYQAPKGTAAVTVLPSSSPTLERTTSGKSVA